MGYGGTRPPLEHLSLALVSAGLGSPRSAVALRWHLCSQPMFISCATGDQTPSCKGRGMAKYLSQKPSFLGGKERNGFCYCLQQAMAENGSAMLLKKQTRLCEKGVWDRVQPGCQREARLPEGAPQPAAWELRSVLSPSVSN